MNENMKRATTLLLSLASLSTEDRKFRLPAIEDAVREAGGEVFKSSSWRTTFALLGKEVRLFTVIHDPHEEKAIHDITFKVGDTAEYGSYNLTYTSPITNIGKCVSFKPHGRGRRLSLDEFAMRNWNYDAAKIAEQNAVTSMSI